MDFANERYVRLYTRDTTTWKRLGWDGQTILLHLLRKADRSGVIDLGVGVEPWEAAVIHCGAPEDVARRGTARCLELECFVHDTDRLVFPRFIEAQETPASNAQRVREHREREKLSRAELKRNVTTSGNDSLQNANAVKRGVTGGNAVPYRAVPSEISVSDDTELNPFSSESSVAHAREEQALGQDSDIETDRRRGSDFMLRATVLAWPCFDHELAMIGAKPERERALALQYVAADPWCQANISRCDPKHMLRKWNTYSQGPKAAKLAKVETADARDMRSSVARSTRLLAELKERRSRLQRADPNYLSQKYDLDKQIAEEQERLDRRTRELHALTG